MRSGCEEESTRRGCGADADPPVGKEARTVVCCEAGSLSIVFLVVWL